MKVQKTYSLDSLAQVAFPDTLADVLGGQGLVLCPDRVTSYGAGTARVLEGGSHVGSVDFKPLRGDKMAVTFSTCNGSTGWYAGLVDLLRAGSLDFFGKYEN